MANFNPNREVALTQSTLNASQSVALASDGSKGIVTTEVTNNISAEMEMQIILTNENAEDATNVPILIATGGTPEEAKLPAGITVTYGEFKTREAALCHFNRVPFSFSGMMIETDSAANILQNGFIISKRNALGRLENVNKNFTKYRGKMGGGEVDLEMNIPAQDMTYIVMPNLGIALRKLAKNSTITLTLVVTAVQDSVKLATVSEARL